MATNINPKQKIDLNDGIYNAIIDDATLLVVYNDAAKVFVELLPSEQADSGLPKVIAIKDGKISYALEQHDTIVIDLKKHSDCHKTRFEPIRGKRYFVKDVGYLVTAQVNSKHDCRMCCMQGYDLCNYIACVDIERADDQDTHLIDAQ